MSQVKSLLRLGAILTVALVMAAMPGWAQKNGCQDLRGLWLGEIYWEDGGVRWGGTAILTIGDEVLEGTVSQDGPPPFGKDTSVILGMQRGVRYRYDFGGGNTFILELQSTAVFQFAPGKNLWGNYRDVSRIVEGTGRFANAAGSVAQSGPYLVWFRVPGDFNSFMSVYVGELHGRMCKE